MPLRDFKCLSCGKTQERYYKVVDGQEGVPPCFDEECGGELEKQPLSAAISKSAVFPYTTKHITGDGRPVTVESLGHLRTLERRYGVCVSGFSQNPGNPDSPRDLPRGRPGGREYEG